jgi:N4-gp56 family major capsid protein
MPQTTTSPATPSSIISRYNESFLEGAKAPMLYSQSALDYTQFTPGMSMEELMRASTVYVPVQSGMSIGTSTLSQTADLTPQGIYDATINISKTSRGEALQFSQQLKIEAFDAFTSNFYKIIGENCMESIEALAISVALAGTFYDRPAARASLDAGTAAHNASDSVFRRAAGLFSSLRVPGWEGVNGPEWACYMHPWVAHDIQEGGKVVYVGEYQNSNIILAWELGKIGRFKLVESPYAKVFFGAGADHDTAQATTVTTASVPLDTTLVTGDISSSIAKGRLYNVGTEETSTTYYPMNEQFRALSAVTTTITLNGQAANGGLKYAHAAGVAVNNNDSAYTMLFAGPGSLVQIYATDPENGDPDARAVPGVKGAAIVGPLKTGLAHQWDSLAWKYWGNFGLVAQKYLYRYECSVSYEHST